LRSVHTLKKLIIVALLGLLVIGITVFFVAQSYINKPSVIEKIRTSFSEKFGGELTFDRVQINLLSGLTVKNLKLTPTTPDNGKAEPFLSLPKASFQYSPLALLRKKIKITDIDLEQPNLLFVHKNDLWLLPSPKSNFIKHALTLSTGHNTFPILLDNVNLNNASITVRSDNTNGELFQANGFHLNGQLLVQDNQNTARGTLSIRNMKFGPSLSLTSVSSNIDYANDEVRLNNLQGYAYAGKAEGAIVIPTALERENQNYGVYLHFTDIDFPSLVKDFKGNPELIHAKVNLYCDLWGSIQHPSLIQGKGYFESQHVKLTGFKVLDIVGNLLNQPNLRNTDFNTLRGSFKISDEQLTFYSLEIISQNLKISAAGTLKYDQTIDFDVLLTINPTLIQQLPANIAEQFSTQPDGSKSISFKVSGMPDTPICNLSDKLYGTPPATPTSTHPQPQIDTSAEANP
jgi:hypothetical protein